MIDWQSDSSAVLLNPRLPLEDQAKANKILDAFSHLTGHFWLATSGTSGFIKYVALSKEAILASAQAVNEHLLSTSADRWLNPLPLFHVGGFSINARAYLSGASVFSYDEKWNAEKYYRALKKHKITLTSLVPTQLFDLVSLQLKAPKELRVVIVGGGKLSDHIYEKAVLLGWPVLQSYGMTECASQVATAEIGKGKKLRVLGHLQVRLNDQGLLSVKGLSLLSGYAFFQGGECIFIDPKKEGWLETEDRAKLDGDYLTILGRNSNFVKIGGENVDLSRLNHILDDLKLELQIQNDMVVFALPDERLGHMVHLAIANSVQCEGLIESFHARVLPFERIRKVHHVQRIPRSALGKVLFEQLNELLPV